MKQNKQQANKATEYLLPGGHEAHRAYEQIQRQLIRFMAGPLIRVRLDSKQIDEANPAACALFGYSRKLMTGRSVIDILADPLLLYRQWHRHVEVLTKIPFVNRHEEIFTADIGCVYYMQEEAPYVIIILQNIVDKTQAEKEREGRELLGLELLKTRSAYFFGEEHERQRLARELHGHIGPMMVRVKLGLEQILSSKKRTISRKELKTLLEQHTDTIREVRIVTSRLAEGYLHEEDINKAIENLIQKFADFGDIRIYCRADKLPDGLPLHLRFHLVQILEEALTNIIKHANAAKVTVRLCLQEAQLRMVVLDNGQGVEQLRFPANRGVWMMQQRAALLGGSLHIRSKARCFFRLEISIPLHP